MGNNSKKVYLAGAIEYAEDHGATWRRNAQELLEKKNIEVFNPCNAEIKLVLEKHKLKDATEFKSLKNKDIHRYIECMRDIKKLDLAELSSSDVVLVYIDKVLCTKPNSGTSGELTLASHYGTPVIALIAEDIAMVDIPGWLLACFTKTVDNLDSAIKVIEDERSWTRL